MDRDRTEVATSHNKIRVVKKELKLLVAIIIIA